MGVTFCLDESEDQGCVNVVNEEGLQIIAVSVYNRAVTYNEKYNLINKIE